MGNLFSRKPVQQTEQQTEQQDQQQIIKQKKTESKARRDIIQQTNVQTRSQTARHQRQTRSQTARHTSSQKTKQQALSQTIRQQARSQTARQKAHEQTLEQIREESLEQTHTISSSREISMLPLSQITETNHVKDIFGNILARLDTLHDFYTSNRTGCNGSEFLNDFKNNILGLLEKNDLLNTKAIDKSLVDLKLPNNVNLPEDVHKLLRKSSMIEAVNLINNLTFRKRVTSRITNFEPAVVAFYEIVYNYLQSDPTKQIGYFIANEKLPCFDLTNTTVYYNELKKNKQIYQIVLGEDSETKTGIFTKNDNEIYTELYNIIHAFFNKDPNITNYRLIVDTSNIAFSRYCNKGEGKKMIMVCNSASKWDAANSGACTSIENLNLNQIKTERNDETNETNENIVYSLNSLQLDDKEATLRYLPKTKQNFKEIQKSFTDVARSVGDLSNCLRGLNNKGCLFKQLDSGGYLDIKRSGDALQVMMTKKLSKTDQRNTYIFVTLDHLAFLKARIEGVNAIFTGIDSKTREKMMTLFKPISRPNNVPDTISLEEIVSLYDIKDHKIKKVEQIDFKKIIEKLKTEIKKILEKLFLEKLFLEASFIEQLLENIDVLLEKLYNKYTKHVVNSIEAIFENKEEVEELITKANSLNDIKNTNLQQQQIEKHNDDVKHLRFKIQHCILNYKINQKKEDKYNIEVEYKNNIISIIQNVIENVKKQLIDKHAVEVKMNENTTYHRTRANTPFTVFVNTTILLYIENTLNHKLSSNMKMYNMIIKNTQTRQQIQNGGKKYKNKTLSQLLLQPRGIILKNNGWYLPKIQEKKEAHISSTGDISSTGYISSKAKGDISSTGEVSLSIYPIDQPSTLIYDEIEYEPYYDFENFIVSQVRCQDTLFIEPYDLKKFINNIAVNNVASYDKSDDIFLLKQLFEQSSNENPIIPKAHLFLLMILFNNPMVIPQECYTKVQLILNESLDILKKIYTRSQENNEFLDAILELEYTNVLNILSNKQDVPQILIKRNRESVTQRSDTESGISDSSHYTSSKRNKPNHYLNPSEHFTASNLSQRSKNKLLMEMYKRYLPSYAKYLKKQFYSFY